MHILMSSCHFDQISFLIALNLGDLRAHFSFLDTKILRKFQLSRSIFENLCGTIPTKKSINQSINQSTNQPIKESPPQL